MSQIRTWIDTLVNTHLPALIAAIVALSNNGLIAPSSHNYAGGHTAWTLSATEKLSKLLIVTNADAAANIIAPAENREYVVNNTSGFGITIKVSGGTGIEIANNKTAGVIYNGTDYERVSLDSTITT